MFPKTGFAKPLKTFDTEAKKLCLFGNAPSSARPDTAAAPPPCAASSAASTTTATTSAASSCAPWCGPRDPHLIESFELPPLDTPEEVQVSINALFLALTARRVDDRHAQFLLDTLRLASRNLRTAALVRHLAAKEATLRKSSAETPLVASPATSGSNNDGAVPNRFSDEGPALADDLLVADPAPQSPDSHLAGNIASLKRDKEEVANILETPVLPPPKARKKAPMNIVGWNDRTSVAKAETHNTATGTDESVP